MKELKQIFNKNNIEIDDFQVSQFKKYFEMIVETNKVLNLTAITEEYEVSVKHFLDSVLPHKFIPQNSKIVDIGSGAGFPAIPLKILRNDLDVCMVDSLNKRVSFLNQVVKNLNLNKITAIHSRAEDFIKTGKREFFDVAVARAVAQLNTLVEYLLPYIKVGGCAIIYKSTKLEEELSVSKNAIKILGAEVEKIEKYYISEENLERNILVLRKIKQSPLKYPRGGNKPKLSPIM